MSPVRLFVLMEDGWGGEADNPPLPSPPFLRPASWVFFFFFFFFCCPPFSASYFYFVLESVGRYSELILDRETEALVGRHWEGCNSHTRYFVLLIR